MKIKRVDTNLDLLMSQNSIKTDKELGKRLELSPAAIWQRLEGNLSMNTLNMLCEFFDVTLKEFLR